MSAESDLENEILEAYNDSKADAEAEKDSDTIMENLAQAMSAAIIKFVEEMLKDHEDDEH